MELTVRGEVWYWRGPAPFHFVTVPEDEAALLADLSPAVTYGWGMIPVVLRVGATTATTSLWPRDGGYIIPIKTSVRTAEGIEVGDVIEVLLRVGR